MKKSNHIAIREVLRQHPDGLTIQNIAHLTGIKHEASIRNALLAMPDVYIDRWIERRSARGQDVAVWCAVEVPPHCPRPDKRKGEDDNV